MYVYHDIDRSTRALTPILWCGPPCYGLDLATLTSTPVLLVMLMLTPVVVQHRPEHCDVTPVLVLTPVLCDVDMSITIMTPYLIIIYNRLIE